MDVLLGRVHVVGPLPQPPGPRPRSQRAIRHLQHAEQIALDLCGAEHVGLTEIEIGIPDPAEERAAVLEHDARNWCPSLRRELETVPENEPKRRRSDGLLNAAQRPTVESGGHDRNDLVGKRLGPGGDACSHRLLQSRGDPHRAVLRTLATAVPSAGSPQCVAWNVTRLRSGTASGVLSRDDIAEVAHHEVDCGIFGTERRYPASLALLCVQDSERRRVADVLAAYAGWRVSCRSRQRASRVSTVSGRWIASSRSRGLVLPSVH